jgi:hypothetical protein
MEVNCDNPFGQFSAFGMSTPLQVETLARERTPSWQKEVCFGVSEVHHKMRRLETLSYHTGEVDSHTTHQRDEAIISVKDFNGSIHSATVWVGF